MISVPHDSDHGQVRSMIPQPPASRPDSQEDVNGVVQDVGSSMSAGLLDPDDGDDDVYEEMRAVGSWDHSVDSQFSDAHDRGIEEGGDGEVFSDADGSPSVLVTSGSGSGFSGDTGCGSNEIDGRSPTSTGYTGDSNELYSDVYVDMSLPRGHARPLTTASASEYEECSVTRERQRCPSVPSTSSSQPGPDQREELSAPVVSVSVSKDSLSPTCKSEQRYLFGNKWKMKRSSKCSDKSIRPTSSSAHEIGHPSWKPDDDDTEYTGDSSPVELSESQSCPFELVEGASGRVGRRITTFSSYMKSFSSHTLTDNLSSRPSKHIFVKAHPDEVVTATALDLVQAATNASSVSVDAQHASDNSSDTASIGSSGSKGERRKRSFLRTTLSSSSCPDKRWPHKREKLQRQLSSLECDAKSATFHRSYLKDAFFPNNDTWKSEEEEEVARPRLRREQSN